MSGLINKLISGSGQRYLVWLVNLLLLIFLAQAVASLTWRFFEDKSPSVSGPVKNASVTRSRVNRQSPLVMTQQLASRHLFGRAVAKPTASNNNLPTQAPETKLALTLKGVIASGDEATDIAIIAPGKKTSAAGKTYQIGDGLPNGASLKEIYGDRVILETRGRVETLTLNRKLLNKKQLQVKR